jgi:two-component system, NtrC family, nitrogen regulation sensor histidine kinase GlnL
MISLETLINNIDEALCLFDARLRLTFINKAGEEFFGRSFREMQDSTFTRLFPKAGGIAKLLRNSLKDGRSYNSKETELDIGRPLNVDLHIAPFYTPDKIGGVIICIRENRSISERDDYQFDHLLYLLGSIAHEIKNPLGGIKGAAQILRTNPSGPEAEECVNLILKEADRLNAVLLGYLTMTRLPRFQQINIHEAVEHAIKVMLAGINAEKIGLQKSYDPSLPCVMGDEGKLMQVFINLVKNAVEAMASVRHERVLTVSTRFSDEYMLTYSSSGKKSKKMKKQRWVVVSFADTGVGVPREDTGRIFMPFYTRKKKGSGLGLSLSKKIIKDHGGLIRVKNQDRGATFSVYLPIDPAIA